MTLSTIPLSETSLFSLFQQFRGCCIVTAQCWKQQILDQPFFKVLYNLAGLLIRITNSRILAGELSFSNDFPRRVKTLPLSTNNFKGFLYVVEINVSDNNYATNFAAWKYDSMSFSISAQLRCTFVAWSYALAILKATAEKLNTTK